MSPKRLARPVVTVMAPAILTCTFLGCGPKKPKLAATPPPATPPVEIAVIETEPDPGHIHVVQEKESLYTLAKRYYGDGQEYHKIYDANKNRLGNPNYLPVGMKLIIP